MSMSREKGKEERQGKSKCCRRRQQPGLSNGNGREGSRTEEGKDGEETRREELVWARTTSNTSKEVI